LQGTSSCFCPVFSRNVFVEILCRKEYNESSRTQRQEDRKGGALLAKLELQSREEFGRLLKRIENGILRGSMSASLEASSDFQSGDARCSVRVFERYSYWGKNRVSLSVTLFQKGNGPVQLCAVTSGGSQALFFKLNTWGEEAFLDKLRDLVK